MEKEISVNILLVDDQPEELAALESGLAGVGYNLVKASSGRGSLGCIMKQDFAIIVLDVQMPGMNGFEAAKMIRQRERSSNTPIIFLTAGSEDEEKVLQGATTGIVDYIAKPFKPETLKAKIALLLQFFNASESLKRKSAELANANRVLKNESEQRQVLEEELLTARKFEAIGLLAGGIAHDFKNLMDITLGSIKAVSVEALSPDSLHKPLERVEKACSHAQELSKRLIDLAKGGDLYKRKVSLTEFLSNMDILFTEGASYTCAYCLADDLWPVEMDEGQMSQVAHHLIVNAKEAMPDGGRITIGAENIELTAQEKPLIREGRYVRWYIKDEGCGIAPDILPRIFDPYYTTKPADNVKSQGMGLPICYSIVSRHDGFIHVESNPGFGTTLSVYLPSGSI